MTQLVTVFLYCPCILFLVLHFEPLVRFFLRLFGVYAIVKEGTCHVYVLFGNVVELLQEPGLHLL
ncbi:MAG: hypothetical protein IPM76_27825 [Chloroflexi bacterium]|nr:hypothetical protein [Chloroflexota bacterium]